MGTDSQARLPPLHPSGEAAVPKAFTARQLSRGAFLVQKAGVTKKEHI
jgi:hypothetical protein